jgi:hypothetical protein
MITSESSSSNEAPVLAPWASELWIVEIEDSELLWATDLWIVEIEDSELIWAAKLQQIVVIEDSKLLRATKLVLFKEGGRLSALVK